MDQEPRTEEGDVLETAGLRSLALSERCERCGERKLLDQRPKVGTLHYSPNAEHALECRLLEAERLVFGSLAGF